MGEIRKVPCGIETEFAIFGGEENPLYAGRAFIYDFKKLANGQDEEKMAWDPSGRLAEQERSEEAVSAPAERHDYFFQKMWREGGNHLLPFGARLYDDGHAELSTPLCINPLMAVTYNRAGYRWMDDLRKKYEEVLGKRYQIYRNNTGWREKDSLSDIYARNGRRRVSYGCHENYATKRSIPLEILVSRLAPFLILRTPLIGSGKIGADCGAQATDFQISQRADFTECLYGSQTTEKRPIYNLRDTPYADEKRFRRIHVISGDANMLELPEWLKIGLTSILIMMVEDGKMDNRFEFVDPVRSFWKISRDIGFRELFNFRNQNQRRTSLDCLKEYADLFWNYLEIYQPNNEIYKDVVKSFYEIIGLGETRNLEALFGKLDWATKFLIIRRACERKGHSMQSYFAAMLDLRYHDNNHEQGLFFREIQNHPHTARITTEQDIQQALTQPPPTRSRWTTRTIFSTFKEQIRYSNYWQSVTFITQEPRRLVSLKFENPYIEWDEELAAQLFALPLNEFLNAIVRTDLDTKVTDADLCLITRHRSLATAEKESNSSPAEDDYLF